MRLKSYAKLNLYLEVLNRRKDNYHNLKTIFEKIDLYDRIILKSRRDNRIKIICNHPKVPKDNSNLAYRCAKLLQDTFHIKEGVDIKIIKRIPVASGLGGGSGNAACVLLGLQKLWKLNLSKNKLITLAKKIGSDVSFFIYDYSFAEGNKRGDQIIPLKNFRHLKLWHILAVPRKTVSTALIYKKWDRLKTRLTKPKFDVKMLNLAIRKKDILSLGELMFNSLEQVTSRLYPQVRQVKQKLAQLGVKSILMSGSGPAVFGVVSSRKEAVSLCRQLKKERRIQVFVARTQ